MYFCFGFMGLVFAVVPFIQSGGTIISRDTPLHQILLALAGASASAVGVIWMFRYLAEAPIEKAGTLVIMMVVTQVVVTWVTAAFFARALPSGQQVLGVAFAISAIFLLSPK
jgi:hypothetical protein